MSKGKKIGGEEWIGQKVETWWGTTSTWETGKIVDYKYVRDEYKVPTILLHPTHGGRWHSLLTLVTGTYNFLKVKYGDDEHWEEVDSLFRFFEEDAEQQKKELLRDRESDINYVRLVRIE